MLKGRIKSTFEEAGESDCDRNMEQRNCKERYRVSEVFLSLKWKYKML